MSTDWNAMMNCLVGTKVIRICNLIDRYMKMLMMKKKDSECSRTRPNEFWGPV
jgi:hypothetical protein